jgi:SAM-dependent methyltransferase
MASEGTAAACDLCSSSDSHAVYSKDGYSLRECRSCRSVFVADPPPPAELARLYSFANGYHVALRDSARLRDRHRRQAEALYGYLADHTAGSGALLDVGCSAGFFLEVAADHGWRPAGVELSPDTAELARRQAAAEVFTGELAEAGFPAEAFDAVTLWDVIEHVRSPYETMRDVHRVLRPGGIVALQTPNLGLFPRLSLKLSGIFGEWRHPEPPFHLFQLSVTGAGRLLDRTGFEPLVVHHRHQPLGYTFGPARRLLRLRRLLYALVFVIPVLVGPLVRRGDEIVVLARKR